MAVLLPWGGFLGGGLLRLGCLLALALPLRALPLHYGRGSRRRGYGSYTFLGLLNLERRGESLSAIRALALLLSGGDGSSRAAFTLDLARIQRNRRLLVSGPVSVIPPVLVNL